MFNMLNIELAAVWQTDINIPGGGAVRMADRQTSRRPRGRRRQGRTEGFAMPGHSQS